jgi:hypothetical protein
MLLKVLRRFSKKSCATDGVELAASIVATTHARQSFKNFTAGIPAYPVAFGQHPGRSDSGTASLGGDDTKPRLPGQPDSPHEAVSM